MKKKIPIAVWKEIQPLIDEYRLVFKPLKTNEYAFHLVDFDPESDFYFKCSFQDPSGRFNISYKPIHGHMVNSCDEGQVDLKVLTDRITKWAKVLKEYMETPSFYDDPIISYYQAEFFEKIESDEPDADVNPFDFQRQLLVDKYVSNIIGLLNEYKAEATEEDKVELEQIEIESQELREDLTSIPKQEVLRRLSTIWAKARKFSMSLITDMIKEMPKQLTSNAIKKLFENSVEIFDNFKGLIE